MDTMIKKLRDQAAKMAALDHYDQDLFREYLDKINAFSNWTEEDFFSRPINIGELENLFSEDCFNLYGYAD